jgi:diaminohydroxyphosphoribosylaminopyrimidine deaminase/5-amino-6-(5-phosphoribosylamino)uracil reductase
MDPNPLVAGKGVQILREHGVQVETGILEKECLELNEVFFQYISTGIPYVAMKYAMTMDGKIATYTGDSKWVTGEEARHHVHKLRKRYSAIMVGIGTVLIDDPMLNCRIEEGVDPLRVICDSHLRIPLESRMVQTAKDIPTLVAYAVGNEEKEKKLREAGVDLIQINDKERVNFVTLLKELGKRNIDSVLIEGGGTFHGTVLKSGLVKRIYCYIAPKLIGGKEAKSPVEGDGFSLMKEALEISDTEIIKLGEDICITGTVSGDKEQ